MLRTNHNPESKPALNPPQANPSEEWEEEITVPLSAVKLDIPFHETEGEATGEAEQAGQAPVSPPRNFKAASLPKPARPGKAGRLESADQVTARLTVPLRAKLWLVFGGFAGLFLLGFGLVAWIFFGLGAQNQAAINQHLRLDRAHQLQMAFASEQAAVSRQILKAQERGTNSSSISNFEYIYYHITFENNLYLLRHEPDITSIEASLNDLEYRYDNLTDTYTQIIDDLKAGNWNTARESWQTSAPYTEDLTARLTNFAEQQTYQAEQDKAGVEQRHSASLLGLGLIAGFGILLLLVLIWLANHFVIGPMGKLNVKLGHLLYGQTARITDHMNGLEHEISSQSQQVSAARHDLKIPLTNIRNTAEVALLCHPTLPSEVKESFSEIIETTDSSSTLINSLLARPDNRLELEVVDLQSLVERVVGLVDLRDFNLHVQVELAEAVLDARLIEHVLLNLLSNARKFSAGGIGIGARLAPVQWGSGPSKIKGEGEVELWVWNDGPIIGANEREIIFRPGSQTAIGRQIGGQGLGLSIVKSIVERHGGRVAVESHEKVGTTFRVFLPYSTSRIIKPTDASAEASS